MESEFRRSRLMWEGDKELAELEAVLAGSRRFADLPPRV
jgi:hypothetical protein